MADRRPRLNPELGIRVAAEADARGVPASWLLNRLVQEGLDHLVPAEEFRLTRPRSRPVPDFEPEQPAPPPEAEPLPGVATVHLLESDREVSDRASP